MSASNYFYINKFSIYTPPIQRLRIKKLLQIKKLLRIKKLTNLF